MLNRRRAKRLVMACLFQGESGYKVVVRVFIAAAIALAVSLASAQENKTYSAAEAGLEPPHAVKSNSQCGRNFCIIGQRRTLRKSGEVFSFMFSLCHS